MKPDPIPVWGRPCVGAEACKLPKEEGTCREFALKWYYDSETNSCARFWYGGCGGNENRFSTQKECEKICISGALYLLSVILEDRDLEVLQHSMYIRCLSRPPGQWGTRYWVRS
ncbi:unnamed protein product [Ranitomeya imitator]|uniref:BPTI/Kunitz inhibitor domain-containing protein n=1 Tax=Ranitomeya imitator TaxID=111125 RepID=A0ABN9MFL9_9NEOB|nr:unnamed protein product [Ranitomeya imitator]